MPEIVIVGEVAVDHVAGTVRLGGASYAARAASASGVATLLAGPVATDVAEFEIAKLERLGISFSQRSPGVSTHYVMLGTGPGQQRSTIAVRGTVVPRIPEDNADAYLIFASPGLDLAAAVASARRHTPLITLNGHSEDIGVERWRAVLGEVDILLLNLRDAEQLGGGSPLEAAARLGRAGKVTVIKHGRGGLTIIKGDGRYNVPAYECTTADKVGAGDTMIGAALARRLLGDELEQAFRYGAAAAAHHIESGTIAEPEYVLDMQGRPATYVSPERLQQTLYLAAPFFTETELSAVGRLERGLESALLRVASPRRDIGILGPSATSAETERAFREDLAALDTAAVVVALLDEDDTGTAWEVGYAYARGTPIVGLRADLRSPPNNMLAQSTEFATDIDDLLRRIFRKLAA